MPTRRALIAAAPLLVTGCAQHETPYQEAVRDLWRLPAVGGESFPALALVRAATLAANGHNTQPWLFRLEPDAISILPDFTRRTPIVDPDDHHLFVSLGCALETMLQAGLGYGWTGEPEIAADGHVRVAFARAAPRPGAMFRAIPRRASTRTDYDGRPADPATLRMLEAAVGPEVGLRLALEAADRAALTDMIVAGDEAQLADPAFVGELVDWIRFDSGEALARRDGLFAAASGNPTTPRWLGERLLPLAMSRKSEADRIARWMKGSAGAAIFTGPEASPAGWIAVGRAFTRFALSATAAGLKLALVNQPVEDVPARLRLARWLGQPDRRPDLVVRFGHGPDLPRSLRRPASAVLIA